MLKISSQSSYHGLKTHTVGDGIVSFTHTFEYLRGAVINSPCSEREVGIVNNQQCARQVFPSFAPIADGKSNPRQQTMGEREMILIGCRGCVVAQLDCPSSRLIKFGNLQTVFPQTLIKLRGYCEVQWNAILFETTLNINKLLVCPLRVA